MIETELLTYAYPPFIVLAAALLMLVLPRRLGYAIGTLSLAAVTAIAFFVPEGTHLTTEFLGFTEIQPFFVDDFSRLVGLGLGFLGTFAVIYAYSSEASRTMGSYALIYVASAIGTAFTGDWLVLVFMWELMAVTSTFVVWNYGGDAVRSGYRYAIAHGIAGNLVLLAVAAHYAAVGNFAYGSGIASGLPAMFATLGMGINVAFIGFHTWLPDTYPKPHFAASVFLSVFTTKTSALIFYRAFPETNLFLAYMGGLMAVYGAGFALLQHDMRALLSYHIQAQLGYIVAGIGLGSALGVAGAMGHLFNNILYKSLLFMAVGVVIYRTGENDLYKLGGLWKEMPITAIGYLLGALSITAVPGFSGFISKGMVLDAASGYFGGPKYEALYWLLFIGAVGTFLSFIKLGYYVFLHGPSDREVDDARPGQTVAMLSVGGACLALGLPEIGWPFFTNLLPFIDGTSVIVGGGAESHHLHPYSPGHVQDAVILFAIAAVAFVLIRKPLSKLDLGDPAMIVNPIGYYTGRGSMLAVTETYRAVDSVAVGLVRRVYWIGNNPVLAVDAVFRRLPNWVVELEERQPADGGRPSTIHLRASIGFTILVLTAILTILLLLLV
ncbi:Na(+)/H(+) antiporter subunit D [Halostagnicola kamekurae]|uniref:Multisubunit sodium/proton antiporter, MrpD subunit n=1 Tax=Halostagnicola kamekurae TaxID=619731 RepID=A0A1I6U3E1_9EURY|nr:Na(+)/H(+) antiporter subunit D [Halostagnicola kamekurae]SFS95970.1 multisubunit sodium/proton antiporter, MrpD subunit [Halostagnicola kamekurae]